MIDGIIIAVCVLPTILIAGYAFGCLIGWALNKIDDWRDK